MPNDRRLQIVAQHRGPGRPAVRLQATWRFAPLRTRGPVVFSAPGGKLPVARAAGLTNISVLRDNGDGTATYAIDLAH